MPAHDAQLAFRERLFEAGLLVPTGSDGVYLRSNSFEAVIAGIDKMVSEVGRDEGATTLHFPLVVPRSVIERTDYLRSFPNLAGSIAGYEGGEKGFGDLLETVDNGGDWTAHFGGTDLALCSAGCHPLYPTLPERLAPGGMRFEVFGNCFRREPSIDPARMQVFRQHEFVYVGDEALAREHRDRWVERGLFVHRSLGLDIEAVVANDPFFGRVGGFLAANQRDDNLKYELVCPIFSSEEPTAITSANCHLDHFGMAFGIKTADGDVAHSACVGFGMERIAIALFHTHGLDFERWPASVRRCLSL